MTTVTECDKRLARLLRHVRNVEENCQIIADAILSSHESENSKKFARRLMRNARKHDLSKFNKIEWCHLNGGIDPLFPEALKHHHKKNPHHPEFWGSIHKMPLVYVAEMVADFSARTSEIKTDKSLTAWIDEVATNKYGFSKEDKVYKKIMYFVNILLEPAFT